MTATDELIKAGYHVRQGLHDGWRPCYLDKAISQRTFRTKEEAWAVIEEHFNRGLIMKRMWIDQPSKLQPLHHLDGTNVLAVEDTPSTYKVYFLSGDIVSQQVPRDTLSSGWTLRKSRQVAIAIDRAKAYVNGCVNAGEFTPDGCEDPSDIWDALNEASEVLKQ